MSGEKFPPNCDSRKENRVEWSETMNQAFGLICLWCPRLSNGGAFMKLNLIRVILALATVLTLAGAPQASGKADAKASSASAAKPVPAADLLDINSATADQLEGLPGVGKA